MELHRATRLLFASSALAASASLAPTLLRAQAFGLNEIGSCAVGRAFAATASPCKDASTIFWNPAAATTLSGWSVTGGVAAIAVNGSFTADTTSRKWDADLPTEWVPHLFVNYHNPTSSWAWGIGAYVPYGLTSQWTDDFPGRFSAKKASLQTFYVQPNVALADHAELVDWRRPDLGTFERRTDSGSRSRANQSRPRPATQLSVSSASRPEPSSPACASRAARWRSARRSASTGIRRLAGRSAPDS